MISGDVKGLYCWVLKYNRSIRIGYYGIWLSDDISIGWAFKANDFRKNPPFKVRASKRGPVKKPKKRGNK